jgi:L-malate glycosyltransferase
MKVLYLIDNYSLGGAQTIIKGIMENNLVNQDMYSIALRHKEPKIEINNSRAVCINSKSKFSFSPLSYIKKFIHTNNIELIHCQLPRSIFFGYLLKRLFYHRLKYIIHEQGDIFDSWIYSFILRIVYHNADAIVACSNATANMMKLRSGIPLFKIKVIYNFVDLKRFSPETFQKPEGFHIGFAGRIIKRKGWKEYVTAAYQLQSDPNLKFYIAGTGSETSKMLRMIDRLGIKNISYLEFKNNIESFYHTLDLLIIPSHFEPMGMVAVEAMACDVAVVASNVPGLNEVVRDGRNGWLITPKSVENLVEIIKCILKADKTITATLRNNALQDVDEYSFIKFEEKINQLYQELI